MSACLTGAHRRGTTAWAHAHTQWLDINLCKATMEHQWLGETLLCSRVRSPPANWHSSSVSYLTCGAWSLCELAIFSRILSAGCGTCMPSL
eukprot:449906-Amphidinium_carterae.1